MDNDQSLEQAKPGKRQVHMTEAGKEYQKETKTKVLNRQFKELKKRTQRIAGDDGAIIPDAGKLELKEWTHSYITLLQTLSDLRVLLPPDELAQLEEDTEHFRR